MSNPLSPAAQAVWAAYLDHSEMDETPADLPALAAALRAAAEELQYKLFLPGNDLDVVEARALFDLADELEGGSDR